MSTIEFSLYADLGHKHELKDHPLTSTVTTDPQFPGVCFLGSPWKETITSEGLDISWEEIGIAFSIPPGAVPEDKPLNLIVWPSILGPYDLPEDYELASPVYSISSFEFEVDIKLTLYHFIDLQIDEDCERMSFISAPSASIGEDCQSRWVFKEVKGGVFQKGECFGSILLRHFSKPSVANRSCKRSRDSESVRGSKRHKGKLPC